MKDIFIHPSAIVETDQIGEGTRIWAFTHVLPAVSIGTNCNIGGHCFIESGAVVGNDVTIKNGTMIWEGVVLNDGVFVGPAVVFTNDIFPRSPRLPQVERRYSGKEWLASTEICEGASLGAGAVIVAGIAVGEFALVAAGAVVTKDVPRYSVVVGNPARPRGWVCECGRPLDFEDGSAICRDCGLGFRRSGETVELRPRAEPTSEL